MSEDVQQEEKRSEKGTLKVITMLEVNLGLFSFVPLDRQ
jgi:hypothetical protein